MISEAIVERTLEVYRSAYKSNGGDSNDAMVVALSSVEGSIEQKMANDQVREARQNGRCPVCGSAFE